MKNIEGFDISFCHNGFVGSFSFEDDSGSWESRKMVFGTKEALFTYLDHIISLRSADGNTSI
jgi:hypothetical protein